MGFVHGAKGYDDWGLPAEEDDVVEWKAASLREAGTHIMGRTTYEDMAAVWPSSTGVYADLMNEIPKVVFSKTLTHADWPESRIASGELAPPARPRRGPHVPERDRDPHLPTPPGEPMRTLHLGLRVADLDRSLAFYTHVGYEVVGEVLETDLGHLTMLKLPGDEFVAIELVHDPNGKAVDTETRLSHLVIQVDSMDATLTELVARGIDAEASTSPDGSDDFRTTWIVDPDGNRIELVQWSAGHADGMTATDFAG